MAMKNRGRVLGAVPYGESTNHLERRTFAEAGGRLSLVTVNGESLSETPRQVTYACPNGHDLVVPLFAEAHVPQMWECIRHRQLASLTGQDDLIGAGAVIADLVAARSQVTNKTHWEQVQARRTTHELEDLLAERLALLRDRRSGVATAA